MCALHRILCALHRIMCALHRILSASSSRPSVFLRAIVRCQALALKPDHAKSYIFQVVIFPRLHSNRRPCDCMPPCDAPACIAVRAQARLLRKMHDSARANETLLDGMRACAANAESVRELRAELGLAGLAASSAPAAPRKVMRYRPECTASTHSIARDAAELYRCGQTIATVSALSTRVALRRQSLAAVSAEQCCAPLGLVGLLYAIRGCAAALRRAQPRLLVRRSLCRNRPQCDSMRFNAIQCVSLLPRCNPRRGRCNLRGRFGSRSVQCFRVCRSTCYAVPTQATVRCCMLAARAGHG